MKKLFLSALILIVCCASAIAQKTSPTTRKATETMKCGDFQGTIKILDNAISKNEDILESYKMRSFVKSLMGDLPGSLIDLNEAIKIDSSDAELFAQRADLKVFLRDETAFDDYNLAIANGYKNYKVYLGRAMFQRNKGSLEEAEADYLTAYRLNPDVPRTVVGYASMLEQNKKIEEAMTVLKNYLAAFEEKNKGKSPEAKINTMIRGAEIKGEKTEKDNSQSILVGTYVETNDGEKMSAEDVEIILNTASAYANLAGMQLRNKQLDIAFTNIQKSIAIKDSDGYPFGIRGQIYLQKGEHKKALEDFDKSIKLMPQMPFYYVDRGIMHLILGDKAKAQADFDKFLEINPRGKNFMDKRIEEAKVKFNINQ